MTRNDMHASRSKSHQPGPGEPRRAFLLRAARAAAFIPPALLTLKATEGAAQKGAQAAGVGGAAGKGKGVGVTGGDLSPVAQQRLQAPLPRLNPENPASTDPWRAPWNQAPGQVVPPWARPPVNRQDEE